MADKKKRTISEVADEIIKDWKNPYFGAKPYINAMQWITDIEDRYIAEDGYSVVRYFLANAGTWRGETARRIKKELKAQLK